MSVTTYSAEAVDAMFKSLCDQVNERFTLLEQGHRDKVRDIIFAFEQVQGNIVDLAKEQAALIAIAKIALKPISTENETSNLLHMARTTSLLSQRLTLIDAQLKAKSLNVQRYVRAKKH